MNNEKFQKLNQYTPEFVKAIAATLKKEFSNSIAVQWNGGALLKISTVSLSLIWDVRKNKILVGSCPRIEKAVEAAILDYEYARRGGTFPFSFYWAGSGLDRDGYDDFKIYIIVLNADGEHLEFSNATLEEKEAALRLAGYDPARLFDADKDVNWHIAYDALLKAGVPETIHMPAYGGCCPYHLGDAIRHFGVPRIENYNPHNI